MTSLIDVKSVIFLFLYYKDTRWVEKPWPYQYTALRLSNPPRDKDRHIIALIENYFNPASYEL